MLDRETETNGPVDQPTGRARSLSAEPCPACQAKMMRARKFPEDHVSCFRLGRPLLESVRVVIDF